MDARQRRFLDGLERVQEHRARGPLQLGDNYVNHLSLQQGQDPISLLIGAQVVIGTAAPFVTTAGVTLFTTVASVAVGAAIAVGVNYSSASLIGPCR